MRVRTDVRTSLPSALEDDKLQTIHIRENNQYRDEDGVVYVDDKGEEQRLTRLLTETVRSTSKGQKLLIEDKDDKGQSQYTERLWQVQTSLYHIAY